MTSAIRWTPARRLAGLQRFAVAITILNLLGHTTLGFEQAWAAPFVALAAAYGLELAIEAADAWATRRPMRCAGGGRDLINFLLPAHISGLAVGMLLYTSALWVVAFGSALAIGSKALLRVPVGERDRNGARRTRHFFNPSNLGISATLALFPWVAAAPPYQFTAGVTGAWDWVLPSIVLVSGSVLNTLFTGRMPLVAAWVGGFMAQALIRTVVIGTPLAASLAPMTGLGFILYTFYMVTDPGTTPERPLCQVAFGAGVALLYGAWVMAHHVFGFYYALTLVSAIRGAWLLYVAMRVAPRLQAAVDAPFGAPAMR